MGARTARFRRVACWPLSSLQSTTLIARLGERSPLSAPYDHGARVLLLGVQANKATALHLAEYRASCIGKHLVAKRRPVLVDGKRRWLTWEEMWVDDHDFIDVDARSPRRSRPTFSLPLSERRDRVRAPQLCY